MRNLSLFLLVWLIPASGEHRGAAISLQVATRRLRLAIGDCTASGAAHDSVIIAGSRLRRPSKLLPLLEGVEMLRDRPWDVPEDLRKVLWVRRRMRMLIMKADGEPEGKRKGHLDRPSARAFQRQVMDKMERHHRYPMTGPVALDLRFRATRRNPASIYNIAKNTLDLLGPALPGIARFGESRRQSPPAWERKPGSNSFYATTAA